MEMLIWPMEPIGIVVEGKLATTLDVLDEGELFPGLSGFSLETKEGQAGSGQGEVEQTCRDDEDCEGPAPSDAWAMHFDSQRLNKNLHCWKTYVRLAKRWACP